MNEEIHIDFETRSDVDITQRGSYAYFASPLTAPLMASYMSDAMRRWLPSEPCPQDIRAHAERGGRFVAHNAGAFEFQLWNTILVPRYGWPPTKISQWRCTMATAAALGLPKKLEKLGEALNLTVKKDKIGKSLIDLFSKPRKPRAGEDPTKVYFNEPHEFPEKFELFRSYCDDDVRSESEADRRMIPLSADEQSVWELDQIINARGVRFDRASAIAAINLVEKAKVELDRQMREATHGAVPACTQVAKLTTWCAEQGVSLEGVAKDDIADALDLIDLPTHVKKALLIRQEAGKSSTSKLKAFIKRAEADDRMRNLFVYHGASPGRWSSAGGVNLANMPRPRDIYDAASEEGMLDPAALFEAFRSEEPAILPALYGDKLGRPLDLVSDAIRGFIIAAPKHDFIAVDYSGIQNVIGAWLSEETWKLEAMRGILADPKLPDMYRRAAAKILNTTTEIITKKHPMRQAVGKTSELSMQFAGGIVALVKMAKNYGLKLRDFHDLYVPIRAATAPEMHEKAVKRYERAMRSRDRVMTDIMTREAWIVCEIIKLGWRATNPMIVKAWEILEDAMRDALRSPGQKFDALKVTYLYARGALMCRLPSNRVITYNAPKLKDQVWAKIKLLDGSWTIESEVMARAEAEMLERRGEAKIESATRQAVTALGVDSQTQKMERYGLYGGLCMENLCLGIERDILVCGMRNVERAGYPVVLHVYDEAVAEVPHGFGSVEEMKQLMLDLPDIYATLPLAAHGWRHKRYRKE